MQSSIVQHNRLHFWFRIGIFCSVNKHTARKIIVLLLLLPLLLGGPLEYCHSDYVGAPDASGQAVSQHDCGARELHKNLAEQDFCIPCHRISTIVACLSMPSAAAAPFVRASFPSQSRVPRVQELHLSILKRGPPPSAFA